MKLKVINYLKNLKPITWSTVKQLPEEFRSNYLKNLKAITRRIEKKLPEVDKSEYLKNLKVTFFFVFGPCIFNNEDKK